MKKFTIIFSALLFTISAYCGDNKDYCSSLKTDTSLPLDEQILDLENQYRKQLGLEPFQLEPNIYTIAQEHSMAMATGKTPYGFEGLSEKCNALLSSSETSYTILRISSNDPKQALNTWLNTAGNKANIESQKYNYTAISAVKSQYGQFFYTQIFIYRKDDYVDYTAGMTVNDSLEFNLQILDLINQHRQRLGLQTLKFDKPAYKQCQSHSKKMAKYQVYLSHQGVEKRYDAIGKYHMAENVAMNRTTNPKKVVDQWLNSEGHRKNIETPDFNCAGISAEVSASGDWYYTMIFVNRK